MRFLRDRLPLVVFFVAFAALMWLVGAVFARFGIPPYPTVARALLTLKQTVDVPNRFHKAVHDFEGVKAGDLSKMSPGVTLITTYYKELGWNAGIRLIDQDGNVLHEWPIDFSKILPNRRPIEDYIHGSHLFPNGDVVFNIEYAGLVKLDRCSNLIWQNEAIRSHHSVDVEGDGTIWVPGSVARLADAEGRAYLEPFQILRPPIYEDTIVEVSPKGETLRTISSIEVLYKNNLQRIIAKMGRGKVNESGEDKGFTGDVFHMNDIEVLRPEMAAEYPMFEAGDLLISLRQLHMIFVMDPDDLRVKWYTITATLSQHDPDFIGGGWIAAFDNNLDLTERGTLDGGSRILAMRPDTGEEKILYPTGGADPIYSDYGGKWQKLSNGNYLITVAREGRSLEVTPQGEAVWQWVTPRYDAGHIPEVLESTRYPDITPAMVAGWTCPN